jgi:hypothetical protein
MEGRTPFSGRRLVSLDDKSIISVKLLTNPPGLNVYEYCMNYLNLRNAGGTRK